MSIELYIKNRLCDINSPESLGIRLKRQFINPAELSVKDAQMSYEITLPATSNNNEIFSHVNVEEVQGKFRIYEDARLYVDGILILDGKFRLSEITQDSYKGNLGVPAPLTAKDIFGETMMNQAGKWLIPFTGVDDITRYNTGGHDKSVYGEISPCIFPLVLYGLLPKDTNNKNITDEFKVTLDDSVLLDVKDIPPSVNCIHMLKQIFKNADYTLTGDALNDERINNLYVSYKNPEEFRMVWSASRMRIKGTWGNYMEENINKKETQYDTLEKAGTNLMSINTDLFYSQNIKVSEREDPGDNISVEDSRVAKVVKMVVPEDGLYKLDFDVNLAIKSASLSTDRGPQIIPGTFGSPMYEVKVLRYTEGTFLPKQHFDNSFYQNNLNQKEGQSGSKYPKPHEVTFIDPKQNLNMICGFSWGGESSSYSTYKNPTVTDGVQHNPMAISGGESWSYILSEDAVKDRFYSAVKSTGYIYEDGTDASLFKVELENAPATKTARSTDTATGHISQIVWLNAGERIALVSTSTYEKSNRGWNNHSIEFDFSLTPFSPYRSWLTVKEDGSSKPGIPMNWNDPASFDEGNLNLTNFLPNGIKINDWIDNFCKAYNLKLIHKGDINFELRIKGNEIVQSLDNIIDIDRYANIRQHRNESLKLPYMYELGFTIDTNEEGYYRTMKNKIDENTGRETDEKLTNSGNSGGGQYYTGSNETNKITQTSTFSYNWYRRLLDSKGEFLIEVPIISEYEAWDGDYAEMLKKRYYDKAQRFWYKSGIFNIETIKHRNVQVALVSNEYNDTYKMILDYENKLDSIMKNFFFLLDNSNDYTIIDCILSAEEYKNLNKSLIRFNGDLYNVAEIDGYDPLGKNQATLKLIRKIT